MLSSQSKTNISCLINKLYLIIKHFPFEKQLEITYQNFIENKFPREFA